VYDLCHGCRVCFSLCTSFPTLFAIVDEKPDQNVHLMTPAEQDKVVDECFQCKMCDVRCPYTPGQGHEWQLDFPRLMLRASAIRKRADGRKIVDHVFGRTDLLGRLATTAAPIANKTIEKPGSPVRKLMAKTLGISSQRMLPPYAKQRFSSWFKKRTPALRGERQAKVAVFPTCVVEYQNPQIGKDLVAVYEHNGVSCSVPEGVGCCGAPWLHSGDFDAFRDQARKNIAPLADAVRSGDDAKLIGAHTFDSSEYLWKLHKGENTSLDTEFSGTVPATTTYHVPCHLQAQQIGLKSRDLMKLTGTKLSLVNKCSGIDGTWGYREENYEIAKKVAKPMGEAIRAAGSECVTGDCHLANGAIAEETGQQSLHPLTFLRRAYGLSEQ
jgi:glycerol-3-phosphate dehydrogenase subunit C